jgi:hypothetical protein
MTGDRYNIHLGMAPWMENALCARLAAPDADSLFFPYTHGAGMADIAYDAGRAVCADCPVIRQCRDACDQYEHGIAPSALWGLWAGEAPKDRARRRRRDQQDSYPATCLDCGRPIRRQNEKEGDRPGTVTSRLSLCMTCYRKRKRSGVPMPTKSMPAGGWQFQKRVAR